MLIAPFEIVTVGVTAYSLVSGNRGLGFGLTVRPARFMAITTDASYGFTTTGLTIRPSLSFHHRVFQITGGYGFNIGAGGVRIPTGFGAGMGFNFGQYVSLQLYYNQLGIFYLGLGLQI
jgi:hypothetical protein